MVTENALRSLLLSMASDRRKWLAPERIEWISIENYWREIWNRQHADVGRGALRGQLIRRQLGAPHAERTV
jgi:hypothetical protein